MASPVAPAARPFRLQPFPGEPAPAGLAIGGSASRDGQQLNLCYSLRGPLQPLRLPEPGATPRRLDDLWQSTCLEAFLALPGDPGYWELNVCPSGDWNLYRLDAYRQGLRPEPTSAAPLLQRRVLAAGLELSVSLPLPPPLAAAPELELGITAVIATCDGELSYWALRHPGEQADFHRREGFALRL